MGFPTWAGLGVCALFLLPSPSLADRIHLKDGKTVVGVVTKEEEVLLIVLTEQGERVIDNRTVLEREKDTPAVNEMLRTIIQLRQENQQLRKGVQVPTGEKVPEISQPSALAELQANLKRLEMRLDDISAKIASLQATLAAAPPARPETAPAVPVAPPIGTPAVAPKPPPARVETAPRPAAAPIVKVLRSNCYVYNPPPPARPFISVNGEIKNDGTIGAKNIFVTVYFKDKNDGVLDMRRVEMMNGRVLKPGARCPFMITPDPVRMERPPVEKGENPKYEIEVEAEPAPEVVAPPEGIPPTPGAPVPVLPVVPAVPAS